MCTLCMSESQFGQYFAQNGVVQFNDSNVKAYMMSVGEALTNLHDTNDTLIDYVRWNFSAPQTDWTDKCMNAKNRLLDDLQQNRPCNSDECDILCQENFAIP